MAPKYSRFKNISIMPLKEILFHQFKRLLHLKVDPVSPQYPRYLELLQKIDLQYKTSINSPYLKSIPYANNQSNRNAVNRGGDQKARQLLPFKQ